jgi:glutamine synthetase
MLSEIYIKNKILLEYVWIDTDGNTRSKNKIISRESVDLNSLPDWNFDGSLTGQAEGKDSDVLLRPRSLYPNPFVSYIESYLVMCDCWNKDETPHQTNYRVNLVETYSKCDDQEPIFGIEQEYVLFDRKHTQNKGLKIIHLDDKSSAGYSIPTPYKWEKHDEPGMGPQGPYYCGVGGGVSLGREISALHLEMCLKAGLEICCTNAEVMASQWKYQIGPLSPVKLSDQIWISRYILHRVSEKFECVISLHPKPYKGDWNGSGAHTIFSTKVMRQPGGIDEIKIGCEKLSRTHQSHMEVYGKFNDERMSGLHETLSMDKFTWAVSNRGCSVRIPLNVVNEGCGYLEDRRPGANADPYLVCEKICSTICANIY